MTDIKRKRGDTYGNEFQVISETTGLAINISGYSFLMTVDPDDDPPGSGANVFQLTGTITDAANGLVEFAPNPTQADNLGSFFYDVQMTDGSGRIRTILDGRYILVQDITK